MAAFSAIMRGMNILLSIAITTGILSGIWGWVAVSMRGMNILLSIAITTGILSGIWGWVAVSLGLLSWAGFLGCTAYFACPLGGLKGLAFSAATLLSGVVWAMVIIYVSAAERAGVLRCNPA